MNDLVERFDRQLPDLINAWETALRSGYSVRQVLQATAEMTRTQQPIDLASEYTALEIMESVPYDDPDPIVAQFRQVYEEVESGTPFFDALDNLLSRVPSEDLNLLIATMNAQRQVGGNLADIFQVISLVMRNRKRL